MWGTENINDSNRSVGTSVETLKSRDFLSASIRAIVLRYALCPHDDKRSGKASRQGSFPPFRSRIRRMTTDGFSVPISSCKTHSQLPNTAQTVGIVVSSPTTARVAPTAFRCSEVSRSASRSAIPAPSMARVLTVKASSGKLRWVSFTIIEFVQFARTSTVRAAARNPVSESSRTRVAD